MTQVILPNNLQEILIPKLAIDFLKSSKETSPQEEMKVVLALYNQKGILAVGKAKYFHVNILTNTTDTESIERLTTNDTTSARPLPGILIQGGRFIVNDWRCGDVEVFGKSDTFGGFEGQLFGKEIKEVVTELLSGAVLKLAETRT